MSKNKLFTEFKDIPTDKWEVKIHQDLKGADYNKKLITKTIDGIDIKPYYRREDIENLEFLEKTPGNFPFVRGNKINENKQEVRQEVIVINADDANSKAKDILCKGVNSVAFNLLNIKDITNSLFVKLFNDLDLTKFNIHFIAGDRSDIVLDLFLKYLIENKVNTALISGSLDYDPIGYRTLNGKCYNETKCKGIEKIEKLYSLVKEELPNFKILTVNASHFRNAGSTVVQELAFGLSIANDYLAKSSDLKIEAKELSQHTAFVFGVGSHYFMEIAKIRAARMLWSKIVEAYNPDSSDDIKMYIHSVTCAWNKTIYDSHVNMLRTTTEAMSAVIGGTDSLTVKPFDETYKKPNDFSERIARNTQIILNEEAYFENAVDPSGGSYYIESLTNSIAENAWKLFLEIEDQGGYLKALKAGVIQDKIEETAKKRNMNLAQRREVLLGTNQYPILDEKVMDLIELPLYSIEPNKNDRPLKLYRGAEVFEELRLKTEKADKTPKVFLLTFGNLAMRKARAGFSTNFFACAGYEIIDNKGFENIEAGIEACNKSNSDILVFCSSDEEYDNLNSDLIEKINDNTKLIVAGYPKQIIDKLKTIGIEEYINIKTDLLETLRRFQDILL